MLKTRIIPKLLLKNGRNVKGRQFVELRDTGHPVTNARIYDAQGADELMFLDIDASVEERHILYTVISRTAAEVFMPFCVGGGVKSVDDIRRLLLAGADKIAINTAAVEAPALVEAGARIFGAQCIVLSGGTVPRGRCTRTAAGPRPGWTLSSTCGARSTAGPARCS